MVGAALSAVSPASLALVGRLARREFRAGLDGFRVLVACVALGVMTIVAVASLSRALTEGIAREGRAILGGDIALTLIQRPAGAEERAQMGALGAVSELVQARGMARAGETTALAEIKAVDSAYPTLGALTLATGPVAGARDVATLLAAEETAGQIRHGALADPALAGRLGLDIGGEFRVGEARLVLRGMIASEPDALAGGIGFGPRLLISRQALAATGLEQPGSLLRYSYRLVLADGEEARALAAAEEVVRRTLGPAGFGITTRERAAPQLQQQIDRFTQFLTLVGLTALLVGGVGVANATQAFVDRQRLRIATLKSLGATGAFVFQAALAQVLAFAGFGTLIGLAFGAGLPYLLAWLLADLIPFPLALQFFAGELVLGAVYGLLTATAFSLWPLARAAGIPVSALLRDGVEDARHWPRWPYWVATALALLALCAIAVLFAFNGLIALIYLGAAAGAFVVLRLVAMGVMAMARRLPAPRDTALRLALINLHKPGALTPSVLLSLGLGLTLLVALVVIDANLRAQFARAGVGLAPSFFFIDVPSRDIEGVEGLLRATVPAGKVERVPQLRGRITALKGVPVAEIKAPERYAWVLEGDRGITYGDALPEGSALVAGEWWPEGYRGAPLVSFGADIAEGLGLKIGDSVTVNVLGRSVTATIANLRKIEWQRLGINFILVFPRSTFAAAPHTHIATLTVPGGMVPEAEAALSRSMAAAFPAVTSVRVREALEAVDSIVSKLTLAIRGASAITLAASVLVLAGALAAGSRMRIRESVILKTLGATRFLLMRSMVFEFALLGAVAASFGVFAGVAAAYSVGVFLMRLPFTMPWSEAALIVSTALVLSVVLGLLGTWHVLGQKPAQHLRSA